MSSITTADKVAEYLAQGYSQADTAKIVGIAESTVTEYTKDPSFKEKLLALSARPEYQQSRISKKYDDLEEKTLNSLRKIASNELTDVSDLTRILDSVSRNRAKNFQPLSGMTHPTVGVTLVFPVTMVPQINLDEQNRVIEIGGKSMRAMGMDAVKGMFAEIEENKNAIQGEGSRVQEDTEDLEYSYDQRATA